MSNNHRGLQRQAQDSAACRHQLQTGMEPASGQTIIAGVSRGLAIAYVAVFPSVVAHLFYNQGLAKIGPAATAQYLNILPLLGAALAIFFLGEKLHGYHIVAMIMIVCGIVVSGRGRVLK